MVGHMVLVHGIEVRVLVGQQESLSAFWRFFSCCPTEQSGRLFVRTRKGCQLFCKNSDNLYRPCKGRDSLSGSLSFKKRNRLSGFRGAVDHDFFLESSVASTKFFVVRFTQTTFRIAQNFIYGNCGKNFGKTSFNRGKFICGMCHR